VPSVHAHAPGDDAHDGAGPSLRDHPITLADIDRMLELSADVDRVGPGAPIRAWRDDLTLVLEALTYARAILSADVAILRHANGGGGGGEQAQSVVDDLPAVLDSAPGADEWAHPAEGHSDLEFGEGLFSRTDQLLSAHQEMAQVDLSSSFDVAGSLAVIEEQLTALTERQHAVEARLQQIRTAVIRQYQEGANPARDQPA
jgi:hypothetical protein